MDYGHNAQPDNNQPFFTAGAGTESPQNSSNPDDIYLGNPDSSWEESQNYQNIGNKAIHPPESLVQSPEQPATQEVLPPQDSKNEAVNLSMPPGMNTPQVESHPSLYPSFDPGDIRMERGRLNQKAMEDISDIEAEFRQGGNAAILCEKVGEMRRELYEKFNRKVG